MIKDTNNNSNKSSSKTQLNPSNLLLLKTACLFNKVIAEGSNLEKIINYSILDETLKTSQQFNVSADCE